jgi:FeS assembly protein IscX
MTWNDFQQLGEALNEAYPKVNYGLVSNADLVKLVAGLPGFAGPPLPPDEAVLSAIGFAWVAAAEGADDPEPGENS